jgi:hypothetical protein
MGVKLTDRVVWHCHWRMLFEVLASQMQPNLQSTWTVKIQMYVVVAFLIQKQLLVKYIPLTISRMIPRWCRTRPDHGQLQQTDLFQFIVICCTILLF